LAGQKILKFFVKKRKRKNMSKNISALTFMEDHDPALAELYKSKLREAKRARSRERQRKMSEAYKKSKETLR